MRAAVLPSLILLAACSTLPGQSNRAPMLAARPLATNFTAAGRVAVRDNGDARRGFSGGFNWTHRPADDTIELLTPLGQIAARMTLRPTGAEIEMSDGRRSFTADPERFLADALGVTLPLAALPNWLQAVPLEQVPFRAEADTAGRPASLWQGGWQIQYTAYSDESNGAHPTRMQLNQGNVEARMIISEWSDQ